MSPRLPWRTPAALAAFTLLTLALGSGCKKEEDNVANPKGNSMPEMKGPGGVPPRMPSEEELLFAQKGCARCHTVGSASGGPPGKRMGPDLSKVGADPEHTPEWFAEFIRNPPAKHAGSKMPLHDESKISEREMATLVKYLSSLK